MVLYSLKHFLGLEFINTNTFIKTSLYLSLIYRFSLDKNLLEDRYYFYYNLFAMSSMKLQNRNLSPFSLLLPSMKIFSLSDVKVLKDNLPFNFLTTICSGDQVL